jgi:hypothetical protein
MEHHLPEGAPIIDFALPFTQDESGQYWAAWGVTKENPNAKYPLGGMAGPYYGNNGRYQDASFVKVRNITLGYTLPKAVSAKAFGSHARVYFNVLNPFTYTKYVGWDPEFATISLDSGNGPSSITYQAGINLSF